MLWGKDVVVYSCDSKFLKVHLDSGKEIGYYGVVKNNDSLGVHIAEIESLKILTLIT